MECVKKGSFHFYCHISLDGSTVISRMGEGGGGGGHSYMKKLAMLVVSLGDIN